MNKYLIKNRYDYSCCFITQANNVEDVVYQLKSINNKININEWIITPFNYDDEIKKYLVYFQLVPRFEIPIFLDNILTIYENVNAISEKEAITKIIEKYQIDYQIKKIIFCKQIPYLWELDKPNI